ncbi:ATP-binding cassette domain-containing protein [Siminovitchia fortis]|uniref:ATP-binding cassette domain-containing protein n=1 Tax=Siminovitchia fortis TaxID=254758 RepID=A0A443IJ19_9BACI|nr:ATP-binding cassette domain-containing protein [Siminovitchia fortis]RWR04377.1 ATP-binding cassette domain-containing protein [Siminovitchia fortis]WHY82522.1 ATP-binding cassette domain-containing protein [Siminovitchia fortis]
MKNNVLVCRNVSKRIKGKYLVKDVSFEVEKGVICGLLGSNGAGKTTLIRMLTGLIRPTKGEILIENQSVVNQRELALEHVGAIVESPIFFPYMTGRDNLRNLARLHHMDSKSAVNEKVQEVLRIAGLEERADEKVRTYSLGMKQRLGIAQSLLGDPDLLILDEPANGLDPMGMRELRGLILTLKKKYGKTILISSHLLDEIQKVSDQIVMIREGELVWKGMLDHDQDLETLFIEMMEK